METQQTYWTSIQKLSAEIYDNSAVQGSKSKAEVQLLKKSGERNNKSIYLFSYSAFSELNFLIKYLSLQMQKKPSKMNSAESTLRTMCKISLYNLYTPCISTEKGYLSNLRINSRRFNKVVSVQKCKQNFKRSTFLCHFFPGILRL